MTLALAAHLNIERLQALPDDGPVTMLNLMRFRERSLDGNGSGWEAYLRYSALAIKLIKARGGTIVWTGQAEAVALGMPDAHRWDYVALVRYPSRATFLDMMTSPQYAAANVERENGCADHAILAVRETYNNLGKSSEGAIRCPSNKSSPPCEPPPPAASRPTARPSCTVRRRICASRASSTAS